MMKAERVRQPLLEILIGGLWHTTSEERYKSIIGCGAIVPNPNIPDSERWSTRRGEKYYPYVRTLGGVSLFDFEGFDPDEYSNKCSRSTWTEFVPYRQIWGSAVWIEINRDQVQDNLISPSALWDQQGQEKAQSHRLMPHIEAAHIGAICKLFFDKCCGSMRMN